MNKKPSQATRVLSSLAHAGSKGICQGDWLVYGGADGRGRITRLAARINELRNEGVAIMDAGQRDGYRVYRLVLQASTQPAQERVVTVTYTDSNGQLRIVGDQAREAA